MVMGLFARRLTFFTGWKKSKAGGNYRNFGVLELHNDRQISPKYNERNGHCQDISPLIGMIIG
jgi:hypothetical protein